MDDKTLQLYMAKEEKKITMKTLTKSNVWELQENDVFLLWEEAKRDMDISENASQYLTILRTAFNIEEVKIDRPEIIKKYEDRGMVVGSLGKADDSDCKFAIKKRPIKRVTDLTYENIHHISAAKLLEIIDRNFGGGWDSLSQSIKDIIESGFEISTTTLPKDRLHKPGGLYEKKISDEFEVLEIARGQWIEAIFAKVKPEVGKIKMTFDDDNEYDLPETDEEDADVDIKDDYYKADDDDDDFDEDKLTEESYRTTFEENPEDLGLEAAEMGDDEDY